MDKDLKAGQRQYLGLDIIRFCAAILVMLYHLAYWNWQTDQADAIAERYRSAFWPIRRIAEQGWVGVPIFFVLSGFVIALSADGKSFSKFVQGRIVRLYPSAWICSSITAIVLLAEHRRDIAGRFIRSIFLWPIGPWVSGVYWTLGVEVVFYLFIAIIIYTWESEGLTRAGWMLTLNSGAYLLLRVLDYGLFRGRFAWLNFFESPVGSLFLLSSGGYFGLGIFMWSVRSYGVHRLAYSRTLALLVSLIAVLAAARYTVLSTGASLMLVMAAPAIWTAAIFGMVVAIRSKDRLATLVGRSSRLVRIAGLMTYPVYLLHDVLGTAIMRASVDLPPFLSLSLAILVILLLSYIVVSVERVPRRILELIFSRRVTTPQVSELP